MKPSLSFKLSQNLALTPQLQQSIRLLQLSATELEQELIEASQENPLLEFESATQQAPTEPITQLSHLPYQGPISQDDDDDRLGNIRAKTTLLDYLLEQIKQLRITPAEKALVALIAGNLDERGYLTLTLEELATEVKDFIDPEDGLPRQQMARALQLLQHLDPAGIGARDLAECILLQLEQLPSSIKTTGSWNAAHAISKDYLEIVAAKDWGRLKKILKIDNQTLEQACSLIRSCKPNPAEKFDLATDSVLIPDVLVKKGSKGWLVLPNPQAMPKISLNEEYARIIKENKSREGNESISQKLQEARWLVKNVLQRGETILKVATAIVDRQVNFFNHGAVAMKPLVLREIADTLGMHESTISRVTTQKYMATPLGTFEFKYFFGGQISTENGAATSATAIRALIEQLVKNENPGDPLSDTQIADLLNEKGVVIARRTIAKYRESLRIPAVHLRRK